MRLIDPLDSSGSPCKNGRLGGGIAWGSKGLRGGRGRALPCGWTAAQAIAGHKDLAELLTGDHCTQRMCEESQGGADPGERTPGGYVPARHEGVWVSGSLRRSKEQLVDAGTETIATPRMPLRRRHARRERRGHHSVALSVNASGLLAKLPA